MEDGLGRLHLDFGFNISRRFFASIFVGFSYRHWAYSRTAPTIIGYKHHRRVYD